jgi:hypothetical protein
MSEEDLACEICSKEAYPLYECRQCKVKHCSKCQMGYSCVDCALDEEEEESTKFGKYD